MRLLLNYLRGIMQDKLEIAVGRGFIQGKFALGFAVKLSRPKFYVMEVIPDFSEDWLRSILPFSRRMDVRVLLKVELGS